MSSEFQFNFRKNCDGGFSICARFVISFDCVDWTPPSLPSNLSSITRTPGHILNNFNDNPDLLTHIVYHHSKNKVLLFVNYNMDNFVDVTESDFDSIEIENPILTNESRITLSEGTYQKNTLSDGNLLYIIDLE